MLLIDHLADHVLEMIEKAESMYNRLILVVAPAGSGKTKLLQLVHDRSKAPLLNVNLELSRRMLDLTERQRALQLSRLLSEMVDAAHADVVLLDNIEVLFDVSLKQDPLRLLQGLSRNKTVVVAWNGFVNHQHVVYATAGHPEHRQFPIQDILVIDPKVAA